jgi:hypothetical protein
MTTLPELFSFSVGRSIIVQKARVAIDLNVLFQLPLTPEAHQQLLQLATLLDNLGEEIDEHDICSYSWGSPFYSSQKAYKILIGTCVVDPFFKWLWKAATQKKHKVFFWLLAKGRLSTRNILRRKNRALPSYNFVLCTSSVEKTVEHLFLHCPFARSCWSLFNLTIIQADTFQILDSL